MDLIDCNSPLALTLAAVGGYALLAHVGLPLWDLLTRLRLHAKPNWALLTNKGKGWALVTGASTGMGKEYALQLARKGLNVVIIADPPTAAQLEAVKQQILSESKNERQVIAISVDLLDGDAYEATIFPQIAAVLPDISVLINNVGMCVLDRFDMSNPNTDIKMMTLNVVPMLRMTKHILPHMRKAKRGCVVNMASLSGAIPTAYLAIYGATKKFVRGFSDSIRAECAKCPNISITVAMPFGVKTPLYDKIDQNTSGDERHDHLCVEAEAAVEAIIRKMGTNREHYGHDLHDLIGCAMAFMSKEKAAAEFEKALVDSVPKNRPAPQAAPAAEEEESKSKKE